MKITLESTPKVTVVNGVLCREWIGTTSEGTPLTAYIHLLRIENKPAFADEFAKELTEQPAPRT